jgi:hypothetical protein
MAGRYGVPVGGDTLEFANRLYLYGTKGRHFWREVAEQQQGTKSRLEDDSDAYLEEIFNMIGGLFTRRNFSPKVQQRTDQFQAREPETVNFFAQVSNQVIFIQALAALTYRERIRIRDYYLTLLHHLGESDYYPISFLVSTTSSWQVAQNFSKTAHQEGNDMIFMGWVPHGKGYTLSSYSFPHWRRRPDLLDHTGLPRYRSFFFPHQKEVTLKGAWFPQYILAYFHTTDGQPMAEVNPFLFEQLPANWIRDGLPVNQRRFHDDMPDTGFGRAALLLDDSGLLREI